MNQAQMRYNLFFNDMIYRWLTLFLRDVREEIIISTATFKDMRALLDAHFYSIWKQAHHKERPSLTSSSRGGKKYLRVVDILNALSLKGIKVMVLASSECKAMAAGLDGTCRNRGKKLCLIPRLGRQPPEGGDRAFRSI